MLPTPLDLRLAIEGREAARSGRGAALRKSAGISQAELAAAISRTAGCLSRWESGERIPSLEAARAYAIVLRQIADDLAAINGEHGEPSVAA